MTLFLPATPEQTFPAYKMSTFPSGESYIKLDPDQIYTESIELFFRWRGDQSMMQLFHTTDALRRLGVINIDLTIPYFPGARADRIEDEQRGESLGVKVYTNLINSQGYRKVTIFDPHSPVTPALLDNVKVISNSRLVQDVVAEMGKENLLLVSPDIGASKKTRNISKQIGIPVIQAEKKRDLTTGHLIPGSCEIALPSNTALDNKHVLIVDDICSRGGTFKPIAAKLAESGVRSISLVVSHYEGCADVEGLRAAGISRVYTTDSLWYDENPTFVTTYPIIKYVS